ncbi:MAG: hypothetical protein AABW83_01045 [Nanoarchaeota archaeon]
MVFDLFSLVIFPGLIGGIGGLIRGTFGVWKSFNRNKNKKFILGYYLITIFIAIIIGIFVGIIFGPDYKVSGLAGYAGTDILENTFKRLKV